VHLFTEKYVTSPRPLLSGIPACRASHAFALKKTALGWAEVHASPGRAAKACHCSPVMEAQRATYAACSRGGPKDNHWIELAQCCHGQSMSLRTMRAGYLSGNYKSSRKQVCLAGNASQPPVKRRKARQKARGETTMPRWSLFSYATPRQAMAMQFLRKNTMV